MYLDSLLAVHTDSNSHLAPILRLDPSETLSVSNGNRGTHFRFGPVAGAAAVTALRLAQIETQAQIALQQLAFLATVTVTGNQYHNNSFAAVLPSHLALLSLLNRQEVSAVGISRKTTEPHNRVLLLQCTTTTPSNRGHSPSQMGPGLIIRHILINIRIALPLICCHR
ncbi:hypothetical protein INR49_002052 [Caranx melampygus]|nr:hypothetical protein INR49_002052 [Caranx melampygus]